MRSRNHAPKNAVPLLLRHSSYRPKRWQAKPTFLPNVNLGRKYLTVSHNHYTISYEKNQYLMTVFQKVDFGIIKEKSDSLWNLIVSPLESAISYKILIFQKIPKRRALRASPFFVASYFVPTTSRTVFLRSRSCTMHPTS